MGVDVSPCLNAPAMGDNMAVEIANAAHEGVLRSLGALQPHEQAIHRRPFPRGPFVEMLNIDDHTGFRKLSWHGSAPRPDDPGRRDKAVFSACDAGYPRVGLIQHPGKRARSVTHTVVVGAEVEGRIGIVCAPLVRTVALCRLTLIQVFLGRSTRSLLSSLVGCWVQVFLYRRPLLSLFTRVYTFISSLDDECEYELPVAVRDELQACTYLAFVAMTDLRAAPHPEVFGTDASLSRGELSAAMSLFRWLRSSGADQSTAAGTRDFTTIGSSLFWTTGRKSVTN